MKKFTWLGFLLLMTFAVTAQKLKANKKWVAGFSQIFKESAGQYLLMARNLPADSFPKTFFPKSGRYEFSGSEWWCSGFYPGTLLYLYEQTRNPALLTEARRILGLLEKEKFNTHTHDLGFMMFCSFGNDNRLSPSDKDRDILITSARSLCTRFNDKTGCIRSWDSKPGDFLVIIDNMMNLELLFWATKVTGDSSFYRIAVTHANTTLKNHFRPDHSSYHVINYDEQTGAVKEKRTAQGAANESAWARGQAWGLYGYTVAYRETKNLVYLQQAQDIADFILTHPNLPADGVPYWDFNAPGIPGALRDASAAAITASALLELAKYVEPDRAGNYFRLAETVLRTLSSPAYRAAAGANGGFLVQHGVGHLPQKTEVDVPLTYGDYYFIEALIRYKQFR